MTFLAPRYLTAATPQASFAAGTLDRIWRWIRRPVLIDRQRRELNYLSDHILKDIGLSRSDVDSIAMHLIDGRADVTRRPRRR